MVTIKLNTKFGQLPQIQCFLQMEWILIFVPLVYLVLTPYTKVEESFNIQATHDVLFHQANISAYDHLEFPGVVPRTFIGPLFLAVISGPFVFVANQLGIGSHFFAQYIGKQSFGTDANHITNTSTEI